MTKDKALHPGDFVRCSNIPDRATAKAIADAFIAAGASPGAGYPYLDGEPFQVLCWDAEDGRTNRLGWRSSRPPWLGPDDVPENLFRELSVAEVLAFAPDPHEEDRPMPHDKHIESREMTSPNWDHDTLHDLAAYAYEVVESFSARLIELDASPDRPAGTAAQCVITIPVPSGELDFRRQVAYMGYCAEACEALDLVVRNAGKHEFEDGDVAMVLVVSAAAGMSQAEKEQDEETTH